MTIIVADLKRSTYAISVALGLLGCVSSRNSLERQRQVFSYNTLIRSLIQNPRTFPFAFKIPERESLIDEKPTLLILIWKDGSWSGICLLTLPRARAAANTDSRESLKQNPHYFKLGAPDYTTFGSRLCVRGDDGPQIAPSK